MYKTTDLLDLNHTIAKEYLEQFEYPWEAFKGIKELILSLGPKLNKDEFTEVKKMSGYIRPLLFLSPPILVHHAS